MEEPPTLLEFSDEILLHIVSYIQIRDVINLSDTCSRFNRLLLDASLCRYIAIPWNVDVQRNSLVRFLLQPVRASIIISLTLHDVYWIPSSIIKTIVIKLKSLEELYVAGTSLSFNHLMQILDNSTNLSALSYSLAPALDPDPYPGLLAVREKLQLLRYLFVHIQEDFNSMEIVYRSDSSLSCLISVCPNLEALWILSWPSTSPELRRCSNIPCRIERYEEIKFPLLHTFVLSALAPLKIGLPIHTTLLLNSFPKKDTDSALGAGTDSSEVTRSTRTRAKTVWVDHPLLVADFKREQTSWDTSLPKWPRMILEFAERVCLPLTDEVLKTFEATDLRQCKHLLVTHGCSQIITLNKLLQEAINLESFHSKALNAKLDWHQFIQSHPKLKAINVSQEFPIPENSPSYPGACVAMGQLNHLKKLSLPIYGLFEIRSGEVIADYHQRLSADTEAERSSGDNTNALGTHLKEYVSDLFSKGRRVARRDLSGEANSISGLDYLTLFCPDVDEFEIGFTKRELGGKVLIGSLVNISRWNNLRKLTLDSLPITDGQFLIDISKGASNLESLRLKDLGPRAKCVYMKTLCSALKFWSKLKDFRLEQNYVGSTVPLCEALQCCPNLERFYLQSSLNDHRLEPNGFLQLMATSTRLFVLYLTFGSSVTKASCVALRKELEFLYKKSRPALSISIRTNNRDAFQFHSVHYRDMVVFTPRDMIDSVGEMLVDLSASHLGCVVRSASHKMVKAAGNVEKGKE